MFANQGMLTAYQMPSWQYPRSYLGVAAEWFINRTPLFSRLGKFPINSYKFSMIGHKFRPRATSLLTTIDNAATTLVLGDSSVFMNGDVLELPTREAVEVTADPNTAAGTVSVRRGVGGTTPAGVTVGGTPPVVRLIGNSRTGGEVFQKAISQIPTQTTQIVETFQHVVSVSGLVNAMTMWYQGGNAIPTPFEQNKMDALQNFMDDVEVTSYYGVGEDLIPGVNQRPKQYGLRSILQTNNSLYNGGPTNAGAYKPVDFLADTIQRIRAGGGQPDVGLFSTDFLTGFSTWGQALLRLDAGSTAFGVDIKTLRAPYVGDLTVIEAPLLRPGTAIILTSQEVRMRYLEDLDYRPYGRYGDATEGDWIGRFAIEVDNEAHHAYLEGVTGFAPPVGS